MSKLRYTQSPEDKRKRSSSLLARGEEGGSGTTPTGRSSKLRVCVSESEAGKDQQPPYDMAEDGSGGGSTSPSSVSSSPTPDSALSPEERKKKTSLRLDALLELFVSEREYVHDLEAAISVRIACANAMPHAIRACSYLSLGLQHQPHTATTTTTFLCLPPYDVCSLSTNRHSLCRYATRASSPRRSSRPCSRTLSLSFEPTRSFFADCKRYICPLLLLPLLPQRAFARTYVDPLALPSNFVHVRQRPSRMASRAFKANRKWAACS